MNQLYQRNITNFHMVKIKAFTPLIPKNPVEFCTNPYDVIEKEEELELKKNPNSLVHLILPEGEGDIKYENAAKEFKRYLDQKLLVQVQKPSIFVFRQESPNFSQEGYLLNISLEDYEKGNIVKHENTREKPLQDRIKIYNATKVIPGLVWTVNKANPKIKMILQQIKKREPLFKFDLYGYTQIVWQETDSQIIKQLQDALANEKVYIADGHHRCAAAADYRKRKLKESQDPNANWQYAMAYMASDDQVRILPYNRVIRKLPLSETDYLEKIKKIYDVKIQKKAFNPAKKHEIAMCLNGKWYKLAVLNAESDPLKDLDVSILQDKVLDPILGIKDPRSDENIFFVGGEQNLPEMDKLIKEQGNAIFFNLYPVHMRDVEAIADSGQVMPPKSTWFDPKLLSGLVLHEIK